MKKAKALRFLADILSALYILKCFLRASVEKQTVIFSRGAFQRDVAAIGCGSPLVIIRSEWLRRFMRVGVADSCLEQVISLSYKDDLRTAFGLSLRLFVFFVNRAHSRIVFGGVDYFEVAIFAQKEIYSSTTSIEAVFHENYAIEYVKNLNLRLYNQIKDKFLFDRLYTYGPPASLILANYTREAEGPRPMVMPRLAAMECDSTFNKRLESFNSKARASNILLLAFPGTEYLAPLCFTSILLELARLGGKGFSSVVKFKNWRSAKFFIKQIAPLDSSIRWVGNGSVENLVWDAGFTLVFNSISLYEALLGPSIIIIPSFLDSQQDENLLQETQGRIVDLVGDMQSICFAKDLADIESIIESFQDRDLSELVISERKARKAIVSNKFYLECKQGTVEQ